MSPGQKSDFARHVLDWETAYTLSCGLAKDCADLLSWELVAKFAIEGALRAHRQMQKKCDEGWLNLAVAYLRVCAIVRNDNAEDLSEVIKALHECLSKLSGN